MKKILYIILKSLAKSTLNKYKPKVVAMTGSVGKTSSKQAVAAVLSSKFNVRYSHKNFNNEIGTPLTILGQEKAAGKNIFLWLWIFVKAIFVILFNDKKYPQVLILEMGADKPGDIAYLTNIAKPDIAIITAIGPSHLEFFQTIDNVLKEKSRILAKLAKEDWAILNQDDDYLSKIIKDYKQSNLKTFGKSDKADLKIKDISIIAKDGIYGTNFKIDYQGSEVPIFLPYVLGRQHAQAASIGALVGIVMGMNLVEVGQALLKYKAARARTNLIKGIKDTWIIDDTYNASPQSSKLALDILAELPSQSRKIAVFGDMLELGNISEEAHREVGREVVNLGIDYLFVVGERSRDIARGAKEAGMSEDKIYHFPFTMEAGLFLQERLQEGDIVLVKGSRGAKMEQVVYEIMAKPWLANDLLVGQIVK